MNPRGLEIPHFARNDISEKSLWETLPLFLRQSALPGIIKLYNFRLKPAFQPRLILHRQFMLMTHAQGVKSTYLHAESAKRASIQVMYIIRQFAAAGLIGPRGDLDGTIRADTLAKHAGRAAYFSGFRISGHNQPAASPRRPNQPFLGILDRTRFGKQLAQGYGQAFKQADHNIPWLLPTARPAHSSTNTKPVASRFKKAKGVNIFQLKSMS